MRQRIEWVSVDDESRRLDPVTLLPIPSTSTTTGTSSTAATTSAAGAAGAGGAAGGVGLTRALTPLSPSAACDDDGLTSENAPLLGGAGGRLTGAGNHYSDGGGGHGAGLDNMSDMSSTLAGASAAAAVTVATKRPYELALTGDVYADLLQDALVSPTPQAAAYLQKVIFSTAVFARMSPDQKASVVEKMQEAGMYVGMCGDGANDGAALKLAHVGIALSDASAEASIAAPFTFSKRAAETSPAAAAAAALAGSLALNRGGVQLTPTLAPADAPDLLLRGHALTRTLSLGSRSGRSSRSGSLGGGGAAAGSGDWTALAVSKSYAEATAETGPADIAFAAASDPAADISCVPQVLLEGRGALATCFQLFRFMALYSMIQFGCCILLYFQASNLGDWQFLSQDMFLVFPLVVLMGETYAADRLTTKRPSSDLLSLSNLVSVAGHVALCLSFQGLVFGLTPYAPGYEVLENSGFLAHSWQVTSLYLLGNLQYVLVATLFAAGSEWKRPVSANPRLFGWLIFAGCFCLFLLVGTDATLWPLSLVFSETTWSKTFFLTRDDVPLSTAWRWRILAIFLVNVVASVTFEFLVMPRFKPWVATMRRRSFTHTEYGKGGYPADGVKGYHVMRREIEDGWYLNGVTGEQPQQQQPQQQLQTVGGPVAGYGSLQ